MGLGSFVVNWCRDQRGGVATEFAIIMPVFLLLVAGIMDFGHAWYMKQIITMASREGARYGARYETDGSGNRINHTITEIQNYVTNNYADKLPADANLTVAATTAGQNLTVTVNAVKTWFILGMLVPGLGNSVNLAASTTMLIE